MRRIAWIVFILILVCVSGAQVSVEFKKDTPFWIVFMEFKGPHSQTPESIPLFVKEVRKQKITPSGTLLQLFFDNLIEPEQGESVWGIGVKIAEDTDIQPPLKTLNYNHNNIAHMLHTGPYESVGTSFNILFPYLQEEGFQQTGPVLTIWLDDPQNVEPEKLRTEILVPVMK